jgi:hypothetical protein
VTRVVDLHVAKILGHWRNVRLICLLMHFVFEVNNTTTCTEYVVIIYLQSEDPSNQWIFSIVKGI